MQIQKDNILKFNGFNKVPKQALLSKKSKPNDVMLTLIQDYTWNDFVHLNDYYDWPSNIDINYQDKLGRTALHYAAMRKDPRWVNCFLFWGAGIC